ncbi:protein VAPYRIN-LIKE-like [Rutidosis leptorrhynchoides]|uniref:protein VAPYRIN-LIKE-like n=1 Tax=Rutidosis leptorrhynchoides TaxID=125765 RepID=UPI003A99E559
MDRLVKPDVKELNMVFIRNQTCSTTFTLTNLMHTMPVAVFVETTSPFLFSFTSPFSVIPPLGTASFSVVSQPSDQPSLSSPAANVVVRSSILVTRKTDPESLKLLFSRPGRHIFKDANIPVSFVGPDVIEFLLSSSRLKTFDIRFILTKSVQFCNGSDLTSLLKSALMARNAYFVTFLIKNGANVNIRDETGESMMSLAIGSGNVDVVRAVVGSSFMIDHSVDRFLHQAAKLSSVDIMEVLCMSYLDLDMNSVDSNAQTPLHIAATRGHVGILEFLVTLGSDPDVVDNNGWTPLHCASREGHVKAVDFLLNSCTFVKYALTKGGKSAIALAFENDHKDIYEMLHLGDVLLRSATRNDVNELKECLAEGVNVNGKDQNGWTALHRAAFKGRIESVKLLLDHGARVDLVDDIGCTALHRAVEAGHAEVARLLIARGARASTKSLIDHMNFEFDCVKNHHSLVNPLC